MMRVCRSSIPGHEYLEANYECSPGFYMASSARRMLCKGREWLGELPRCKIRRDNWGPCASASCDQLCKEIDDKALCSCYEGFRSDGDKCNGKISFKYMYTCVIMELLFIYSICYFFIFKDVNECNVANGNCEYKCINSPGSYRCECPIGLRLREDRTSCTGE